MENEVYRRLTNKILPYSPGDRVKIIGSHLENQGKLGTVLRSEKGGYLVLVDGRPNRHASHSAFYYIYGQLEGVLSDR